MNVLSSIRVRYEDLRSLSFTSISGIYAAVGTPFNNPVRIIKVSNFTDANLIISFNGIDDKDVVASNGFCLYDYGSNKADQAGTMEQAAGDRLYVRQESGAPTVGTVYVTVAYASQV